MEYTNIISLVPQGEHFDPTAMNEGIWMTANHVGAIENSLTSNATGTSAIQESLNERDQQIQSLTDQLNGSKQVLTERDATIAAQAIEIANLKAAAAKPAAVTVSAEDDLGGSAVVESELTIEARKLRAIRDCK